MPHKNLLLKRVTQAAWRARNPGRVLVYSKRKYWNYRTANLERSKMNVATKRAWLAELKKGLKCERCGFAHPAALAFHHRDRSLKTGIVSQLVLQGRSEARIRAEIAKCVVLCANCHLIEHAEQRRGKESDWWKSARPKAHNKRELQVSLLEI